MDFCWIGVLYPQMESSRKSGLGALKLTNSKLGFFSLNPHVSMKRTVCPFHVTFMTLN